MEVPDSAELRALIALRDAARLLLSMEADPACSDGDLDPVRAAAAARYAKYVGTWGPLNRGVVQQDGVDRQSGLPTLRWQRPDLGGFRRDPDYLTVMALEVYDAGTGSAEPAPILRRRVHGRSRPVDRVATPLEALAVCLGEGGLDLARVADLLGLPDEAAAAARLGELIFRDPEQGGRWVTAVAYLHGDIRAKLAIARECALADRRYRRNVTALTAAVPPELGPLEISASLGAPWVSAGDIEAFVHEVLGGRVKVWHLPSAAHWRIVPLERRPSARAGQYSTARMSAYQVLEAGLNGRSPVVFDTEPRPGGRIRVRNAAAGLAAQDALTALQERFRTWIWEDAERSERLCAEYNRRFNSHVTARWDGSGLTFPGLADGLELWPWQRDVVAQILASPATLCGHAVGAGKTRSMVCTALTARRLGLADKPVITVPAHLLEQTAREARQAYPAGRFLVAGEELAGSREALAAHCATGDWDAVIMSHGVFSAIPVAPATESASLEQRVDELEAQVRAGQGGRYGRTVLRRRIAALEARLQQLRDRPRPALTFDDLGVDLLLVDEAHYFKRLPIVSRMEGISLGSSQRAADLLLKARGLRARRDRRPSLALFTGTPWSNTIAETFVWQTFLQPDALAAAGVEHFDAWAAVFVEYESLVEVTPDTSAIRVTQRPSRIRNLPELRAMFARASTVLPARELGLERPECRSRTVVCEPGPEQRAYVRGLAARVDKLRRERVRGEPGGDNMLAVCGDGRRAALDPLLVGVDEASTKIAALADTVARVHAEHADARFAGSDHRGVFQLVFCDQGTPGPYGLQTYGRIRNALAARGIAADRIRWVHEATTGAARAALFAECRAGAVSVLIGSTDKLGVGTNVQTRLRAVHHADAPWRPSDLEQREGRALRPGNLNPVVDVFRYVTKGSFDAYMWQTLQRKASFLEQLYGNDPGARTVDDIGDTVLSYAEVKALATGNALLLEHAQAAADLARLRILRAIDTQTVTAARRAMATADHDRFVAAQQERMLRAAQARLDDVAVGSGVGADPDAAAQRAAAELRQRLHAPVDVPDPAPVRAPWRGLGVELLPAGGWRAPAGDTVLLRITLAHRRVDELALPAGRLRRRDRDAAQVVTAALNRWLAGLERRIADVGRAAVDADDDAERARATIANHRFTRMDELAAAEARLAEITTALESAVGTPAGHAA